VLLLVLVEGYTWLMCRTRRLAAGTVFCLDAWSYGLIFSLLLLSISPLAAQLMLPFLLWTPIEAVITWQMRQLNPGC
jgi:tryptophan-rich sensory protein